MHGLINRAIEQFVRDTYGRTVWIGMMQRLDLGFSGFEAMMTYEDEITGRVLDALADSLRKPREDVLEDIGTYLVSHPNTGALRRLLRFGGVTFVDFLHSLDDLSARASLAVPDLVLPQLELREHSKHAFSLAIGLGGSAGLRYGHAIMGLLRAMADDYGALVFLDHKGRQGGVEIIEIRLLASAFAVGRDFSLGRRAE